MSKLGLGVFFGLMAVALTQFYNQFGGMQGYYGGGPFAMGRQPIGMNAPFGAPVGMQLGLYSDYYSNIQRRQIYAANLGYDQTSAMGPECKNGVRDAKGLCMCYSGFQGADCGINMASEALDREVGVICDQTPGTGDAAELLKAQQEGPLGGFKLQLKNLMAMGVPAEGVALTGPGISQACANVAAGSGMAPITLKSARTDYGFITCSENNMCYNHVCADCTMFNPQIGGCDHVRDNERRGLTPCSVTRGETPYDVKVQRMRHQALQAPKLSAEGGQPVGNAFFGPPNAQPFVGAAPFNG